MLLLFMRASSFIMLSRSCDRAESYLALAESRELAERGCCAVRCMKMMSVGCEGGLEESQMHVHSFTQRVRV